MNNFRFNLKGQLNEVKLPEYKALWPLFETIVNSIQSIEESTNSQNGQITILANRLEDRQVNMDGNEELNPFYEFQVIDNGEGFNSINYAKQRNQILFDKLFNPKVNEVLNSKLLNE